MGTCEELEQAVQLVDWQPRWLDAAHEELGAVRRLLVGVALGAEHVGSTAVPDLMARPLIDLVVGVADDDALNEVLRRLDGSGYRKTNVSRSDGEYLIAQRDGACVTLHIIEYGGSSWRELIATRDFLRAHPQEAAAYGAEKRRVLAAPDNAHPSMYTGGKSRYTHALVGRAVAWAMARNAQA